MNKIGNSYKHYEDLVKQVGAEKIERRFDYLLHCMCDFIDRIQAKDHLYVSDRLLMHSVLEYFEDISKVKDAHEIEHANSTKVMSYSAYWILRRHPIQIVNQEEYDDKLVFANEKFVLTWLIQFLIHEHETIPLVGEQLSAYRGFLNTFFYYLKFRKLDAQSIEMILLAFQAGQIITESFVQSSEAKERMSEN